MMSDRTIKIRALRAAIQGSSAVIALAASASALAQADPTAPAAQTPATTPAPAPAATPAATQAGTSDAVPSDEIVVTAQRRAEALENVPMAITVITGATLDHAGVVSFQDLGAVTAGAQVNFAGAFTQPSIRGVTTLTNGNNIENNVAVYVDGFYEPNPLIINADLPNLGSIEVLKGPQGTLYGRNATGGAILINTLEPSHTYTGRAQISYGRFDDKRASAYVSGPLSSSVRLGVAAYYRQTASYIRLIDPVVIGRTTAPATPIRQASIRAKLEADLSSSLTATLGYNFTHVDDARTNIFSTFDHVPAAFPQPPLRPTVLGTAAYNYQTSSPNTNHQGTLKLAWKTGSGTLTSYTGYEIGKSTLNFDGDGTYADLSSTVIDFKQRTFQQALDYAVKPVANLDLLIGGLYYNDKLVPGPAAISVFVANRRLLIQNIASQRTRAWAVYADATYHVTDALSLDIGGRYSSERKMVDINSLSFAANPAGTPAAGFPVHREATFSKFTPRASIRYEIAPRTNIYASYSQGFRSGAFSLSPPAVLSEYKAVRPETINAFEVGFKTARRMVRFDIAGFYYDYKDLQVNSIARSPLCPPLPTQCGLILTLFQNAQKAEVYGMDAQVSATPVTNLNVRAGVSLLHARYKIFPNATGTGLNAATNLNATSQLQDWAGQQTARAPNFSGNFGFDYNIPMRDGGLLFAGNVNFTDSYVVNNPSLFGPLAGALANQQRYRQSGYALVNASVTWTDPSGHYYIGAYGRNLTNKKYRITYTGNANGDYGSPAEPATYGVRAGFQF